MNDDNDSPPLAITEECSEKRGKGRPLTYKPEFAAVARGMCVMGATDNEIARELGVDTSTVKLWQVTYKAFSEACITRKGEYDDRVERSLAQRALGYSQEVEKVHFLKDGTVVRATVIEHIPADVGAAKQWLGARRAKEWSEIRKAEIEVKTSSIDDLELARKIAAIMATSGDAVSLEVSDKERVE